MESVAPVVTALGIVRQRPPRAHRGSQRPAGFTPSDFGHSPATSLEYYAHRLADAELARGELDDVLGNEGNEQGRATT
jgi:hypothetical protein